MGERIRVLLVDDHRMFSEAIELLLSTAKGIEIIGAVGTGEEAVELARTVQPDVVLMDIGLPGMDGIEATRKVREVSPNSQIVIVTAFQYGSVVARAVEAGAIGFLPKTRASDDLVDVIRRAAAGEIVLSSGDVAEVLGTLQRAASYRSDGLRLLGLLTSREIEILKLVAQGNSTAEIAKQFFISPFTVQTHVRNILSKLGVHSKLEAVTFALRHGAINVSGADAVAQSRRR